MPMPCLPSIQRSAFRMRIPRLHGAPEDTEYELREFALIDPDGNLLRIGSFLQR
jgi:hypothetical protein